MNLNWTKQKEFHILFSKDTIGLFLIQSTKTQKQDFIAIQLKL